MTGRDLKNATIRSIERGSVKPLVAEGIRQVGAWGGGIGGAWAGAELGLWCGPYFLVCSTAGGMLGYWVGDEIGDLVDDTVAPSSSGQTQGTLENRRAPTATNIVNSLTGAADIENGFDRMNRELDMQAARRH
jgi:phage tail tape-measure protein